MLVNINLLASNPFFDAYVQSDFLGKCIFVGLILLSIVSWTVLLHKVWLTRKSRQLSQQFQEAFQLHRQNPLSLECEQQQNRAKWPNPFLTIYIALKKITLELINKNRHFLQGRDKSKDSQETALFLSPADIDFVESHVATAVCGQIQSLEKNLFILSTTVSLAPFLGLLGTVWGILTTFSEMQAQVGGNTSSMVIGGLSLALATTVLGLLGAIPALVGYNYLKTSIKDFETDMERFSYELLASIEMHYRKVE